MAARTAAAAVGILALLALAAASVRVLPWLVDPTVPWRVAIAFGRAVVSVALEAAILVGWPVGWALGAFVLTERGEARVLAMLGQRPGRTIAGLVPLALLFAAVLAAVSLAGGRDASEPGRVVAALLSAGRRSCDVAAEGAPQAFDVPLLGASWLCTPRGAGEPRLVGRPPFGGDGAPVLYSARAIEVSADARRLTLDDAWLATRSVQLHAGRATFRLPPFVRASSLPAAWRAALLSSSAAGCALFAAFLILAMDQRALGLWRLHAILLGAAGPVVCLALLHALERASSPMPLRLYALLPVAALTATAALGLLVSRLPGVRATATK